MSQASSQTLRELITDGRLESEARSLLKKPDFLFGDSIDEDVEVMLNGSYKCLLQLGECRFFLPDMERMFSLSFIQPLSLHQLIEWDLTEEHSHASLRQICEHTAILVEHDKNVVGLLPGSLEVKYPTCVTPYQASMFISQIMDVKGDFPPGEF